jgi:hypothetical protein
MTPFQQIIANVMGVQVAPEVAIKVAKEIKNFHAARPAFLPHPLLDRLIEDLKLKNDRALSKWLGVDPPIVSKIRNGGRPVSAALMIRIFEGAGISFPEIRKLCGIREGEIK